MAAGILILPGGGLEVVVGVGVEAGKAGAKAGGRTGNGGRSSSSSPGACVVDGERTRTGTGGACFLEEVTLSHPSHLLLSFSEKDTLILPSARRFLISSTLLSLK